jgi:tRNA-intron endonuclease
MQPIKAIFIENHVLTEASPQAIDLHAKSVFGTPLKSGQVKLSLVESLYLHDAGKVQIMNGKKPFEFEQLLKKCKRFEKNVITRFFTYKDLRDRGYTVKTALKFGADFRVYDKGIKPGEDHAKWVVYPVDENAGFTWHDFSAKNRVAHSTKKRLMIATVDDEGDVTYYEVKWMRP